MASSQMRKQEKIIISTNKNWTMLHSTVGWSLKNGKNAQVETSSRSRRLLSPLVNRRREFGSEAVALEIARLFSSKYGRRAGVTRGLFQCLINLIASRKKHAWFTEMVKYPVWSMRLGCTVERSTTPGLLWNTFENPVQSLAEAMGEDWMISCLNITPHSLTHLEKKKKIVTLRKKKSDFAK